MNPKYPDGLKAYVSIDVETSDLHTGTGQLLEVAVIVDDLQTDFEDLQKLHLIINHPCIRGNPTAIAMNADLIKVISALNLWNKRGGKLPEFVNDRITANTQFIELEQFPKVMNKFFNKLPRGKYVPAGKNYGGFDKLWLEANGFVPQRFLTYRSLDPAPYYFNPRQDSVPPSLGECMERAGLKIENLHNAMDDAWAVCQLLRKKL